MTLLRKTTLLGWPLMAGILLLAPAHATELELDIEIPRLNVAEYHRPYVAVWVQGESRRDVTNLAVWYDPDMPGNEGEKWLKDMRQWWRRSGRGLDFPIDGITGATRAPGTHTLTFADNAQLSELPAGQYDLWIEAAREVGGRELVKIPFTLPVEATQELSAQGESELGQIRLRVTP